jgi:NADH-quinone oxidoreductase subunit L
VLLCASVAIAGVPPFSGFHSKDAILLAAYAHAPWMYWVGVVTAGLTAFYVFRAFFLCFFGSYRGDAHPHESPWIITAPLGVLALLSLGGGYIDVPRFLSPVFGEPQAVQNESLVYISVGAALAGIFVAWLFYVARPGLAESVAGALGGLYRLVYNKYFVDEAYDALIVNPIVDGSRTVLWRGVDAGLIDGAVDGAGSASRFIGGVLRLMQSGYIRRYAAWVVVGSILVILAVRFAGGAR